MTRTASTAATTTVYAVVIVKGEAQLLPVAAGGTGKRLAATVELIGNELKVLRSYTTRQVARRAASRAMMNGRVVISAITITAEQRTFYLAFCEANRGRVRYDDMFRDAMRAWDRQRLALAA